jgi:hypothetical protein
MAAEFAFDRADGVLSTDRDGGNRWTRVNVGSEADGAIGNSDVDLAMARDGTLYFVTNQGKRCRTLCLGSKACAVLSIVDGD